MSDEPEDEGILTCSNCGDEYSRWESDAEDPAPYCGQDCQDEEEGNDNDDMEDDE